MKSFSSEIIAKFSTNRIAFFKNKKTEVAYNSHNHENIWITITRPSGKQTAFKIPLTAIETAVKQCKHEKRLLKVSELHRLEGVGSWLESPVWAILNSMDSAYWHA